MTTTPPTCRHLILDAHGVVFNNPFVDFLATLAVETQRDPRHVHELWYRELRIPAWTGSISERELWQRLVGTTDFAYWRERLEGHYELGPAASRLPDWRKHVPIWLLSNHRTEWLLPRLQRFRLSDTFERIMVSDQIGLAKPDAKLFRYVVDQLDDPRHALFVDDRRRNTDAAMQAGISSLTADEIGGWQQTIDRQIRRVSKSADPPLEMRPSRAASSSNAHE